MSQINPQIELQIIETELDRAYMIMKDEVRRDPFSNSCLALKEKVRFLSRKRLDLVNRFSAGELDWR